VEESQIQNPRPRPSDEIQKAQKHPSIMTIDDTMGSTRRMFRVITLLFFLFLAPIVVSQEEEEEQEQQYLYAENAGVVVDYMPSPSTGDPVRPDFLYSPYNGPRIVEFYGKMVSILFVLVSL
jgi:hypothetical protein